MENIELKMEEMSRIAGGTKLTPDEQNKWNRLRETYERWARIALERPTEQNEKLADSFFDEFDKFHTEMLKKYGLDAFYDN